MLMRTDGQSRGPNGRDAEEPETLRKAAPLKSKSIHQLTKISLHPSFQTDNKQAKWSLFFKIRIKDVKR